MRAVVETERLWLRDPIVGIAKTLVPIDRDGRPRGYDGPVSEGTAEVLRATAALYESAGFVEPWVCYLAFAGGVPAGTCGFKSPPREGRVEIAYHTFPGFEGRGLAATMAADLIAIAGREDPAVVVTARTLPERSASHRILERLGFHHVATLDDPEDGTVWEWQLESRVEENAEVAGRLLPPLSTGVGSGRTPGSRWEAGLLRTDLEDEWKALFPETSLFLPAAREICRRHGLSASALERMPGGSTPVFAIGRRLVLKVYCPYYRTDFAAELASLRAAHGSLTVPVPEVVAHGSLEGWPYLVMSRLSGRLLADVRQELTAEDRQRIVEEMGRALAALHAIRVTEELKSLRVDWPAFLEARARVAAAQQERRGLGPPWVEQIAPFLADHPTPQPSSPVPVLLHTEPTDSAWLVRRESDAWTVSGLIDFADAITGDPEYDFPAVGIFVTRGDRALFRRFLLAYGYAAEDLDDALRTRLMRLTLLHRYAHLPWFIAYSAAEPREPSLQALAEVWFGCS